MSTAQVVLCKYYSCVVDTRANLVVLVLVSKTWPLTEHPDVERPDLRGDEMSQLDAISTAAPKVQVAPEPPPLGAPAM